jgi:vanillate O-demethylase ferredoxin subunit
MITVLIAERVEETPDIARFVLRAPDGAALPAFTAGAHIDVEVREGLMRQYSLCNDPVHRDHYEIAVLKDPESRGGSVQIHDAFAIGDRIRISEPRNMFELKQTDAPVALFGGGIGITPMVAMAHTLHHTQRQFEMHYCSRSADSMAMRRHLEDSPFSEHVHLHFDDGGDEQRLQIAEVLEAIGPDGHVYVCGPGGFIDWVCTSAKAAGFPDIQVHKEFFAVTADPLSGADNGTFDVVIASTGQVFSIGAEETIIDVLEENGIEILMSCQQGICGSCITTVLEGDVVHHDQVLTEEQKNEENLFTPCCSRAAAGGKLVLNI